MELLKASISDENASVRQRAIKLLSELADQSASVHFIEALRHDVDCEVRIEAAMAIGKLGENVPRETKMKIISVLSNALADKDKRVRLQAISEMDRLRDAELYCASVCDPLFVVARTDPDPQVKAKAKKTVLECPRRDCEYRKYLKEEEEKKEREERRMQRSNNG